MSYHLHPLRRKGWLLLIALSFTGSHAYAQGAPHEAFPISGTKWPYSPLAIPTKLKPVNNSLTDLLNHDFHISNMTPYPQGAAFLLSKLHTGAHQHPQQILCILNPPQAGTDVNVPTSRCWSLN